MVWWAVHAAKPPLRAADPKVGLPVWMRFLREGARLSGCNALLSGLLVTTGAACYLLTIPRPRGKVIRRSWTRIGRRVLAVLRWDGAMFADHVDASTARPRLLSQLQREYEGTLGRHLRSHLQRTLQDSLDRYRPSCPACGTTMYRQRSYIRSFLINHGDLRLDVPVFRCAECRRMASGADIIGSEDRRRRVMSASR